MIIGIDATNIREGGGVTHLVSVLNNAVFSVHGINKIVVFGSNKLLGMIIDRDSIIKKSSKFQEGNLFSRIFWQAFCLRKELNKEKCDVLFVPGGSFITSFKPVVTMSQNLLPFDLREVSKFGLSLLTIKLLLLRLVQSVSFRRSQAVIFLTKYAKNRVLESISRVPEVCSIVPHGINESFFTKPKKPRVITSFSSAFPFRVTYVSNIAPYKHQQEVVEAVLQLVRSGFPLTLELFGNEDKNYGLHIRDFISATKDLEDIVMFRGLVPHAELANVYQNSDLIIFASSCENLPCILMEAMASGVPIACSNRQPMPEVLGEAGVYFNPENVLSIKEALKKLIQEASLREKNANMAFEKAKKYSWKKCSSETLGLLSQIARGYKTEDTCSNPVLSP